MRYSESQKFDQPGLWMALAVSGGIITSLFGFGIYRQILLGHKFGNHPMSDQGLIAVFLIVLLLFILLFLLLGFSKLTTLIDESGICFRFFPFQFKYKKIKWEMIAAISVVSCNPLREFGGWGIRRNKNGKAYNVSGDKGLQIRLKSGGTILIGTQNPRALNDFLTKQYDIYSTGSSRKQTNQT
ncbi:MAG: hypothetical protein WCK34_07660 [Bacteroidota bacterium]